MIGISSQIKRQRVVVLGLDGVPYTLLDRLFQAGVMPSLAAVARSGSFLRMETSLPPVSSVAWTSFMTGVNPGRHGIFGFTDLKEGELALKLPSFDDIQSPTLWARMPDRRALVINLPFTYPARPLNGVLISGFVAPSFERAVYPPEFIPWLQAYNYRIDVDAVKGRADKQGLINELFETLLIREQAIFCLMEKQSWYILIAVITGTDRLHHFFFDAADDPSHPHHGVFMDYYRRIDAFIGALLNRIGGFGRLIALSDHGFAPLKTQVYLNEILQRFGYLSFLGPNPKELHDISPTSHAFAMDPSRIYLNRRDRFRQGLLSPADALSFRKELKQRLESMTISDVGIDAAKVMDQPDDLLFQGVFPKEDIYEGECMEFAPDLVLIPRNGYDLKATLGVGSVSMNDIFTGTHTHDDAFLIVNEPSIGDRITNPHITNVAELIYEAVL